MTTYVLGAGASVHAGYPLCSALWSQMAMWVIQTHPPDSEHRQAIDTIAGSQRSRYRRGDNFYEPRSGPGRFSDVDRETAAAANAQDKTLSYRLFHGDLW